ncbi:GreA/GreB family elongation factor [Pseudonocardia sp.]|jgi:transcription elongation factor GreA|uniref:GreA/GreB family elongation factor n=1 Tax=Pseudonocardia sp. TaxID=60912 RepID=UPI002626D2B2|nr:GreA/GreB family elongation factor [Pseudonocardia sp.]MCW2719308.1 transcription elongation factor GreA [Pseudonocardia sp.]
MVGHDERHALLDELDLLRKRRAELEGGLTLDDAPQDFGERSEATMRRDELDWIDRKIRDLTHFLHLNSRRDDVPPDRVGTGSLVTLRYANGERETLKVTDVPDDDFPTIATDSPLGRAVLGAPVGAEISWTAPEGRMHARVEDHVPSDAAPVRPGE